jgi:ABC-type transport system involved in cytochrome bd biosynthesis fused ATPase/permease subunit
LDEATSILNAKTDEQIQLAVRVAFSNSTVLLISHRTENILNLDKTLEVDNGTVNLVFVLNLPLSFKVKDSEARAE